MSVQEQILQSRQQQIQLRQYKKDKNQDKHRAFNSFLILAILCCSIYAAYTVHDKFGEVDQSLLTVDERFNAMSYEEHKTSELAQLVADEGYKKCIYDDSRGLKTIGFGHLMLPTDTFKCISSTDAVRLLRADYTYAENSVDTRYPWSYGETRLILINMTYQMGAKGVSKFKLSLACLEAKDYDCAASELLDSRWAAQTPNRAARLAGRIMSIPV